MTPRVHRLNRSAVLLAVAVALVAVLPGCGTDPRDPAQRTETTFLDLRYVDLPDGSVVTCVVLYRADIDCDWANAAREGEAP